MAKEETDPEIADLLKDLADYLHDEEWWLSSDYDRNDWAASLARFKQKWFREDRSSRLRGYIDERIATLRKELITMIGEE